jgi:CHAD domain-containing protein
MALRLKSGETLAAGLDRAAAEEIERARTALLTGCDPEAEVLEARKSFKKVRAILRLSRESLGERRFRLENRRYRDLARRLADQRMGAVWVATLNALAAQLDGQAPHRVLRASRRRLIPLRRRHDDGAIRAEVAAALATARPGLEEPLSGGGFDAVRAGLLRTYRKGRKGLREASECPSAAAFHEWRKRVKDLWYQIRLFASANPAQLDPLADEIHRLSAALGHVHDLDLLECALELEATTDPFFHPSALLAALRDSRAPRRAAALDLGSRLYTEKPDAFVARVESYWRGWREAKPAVG